jgi:hypothetical protein
MPRFISKWSDGESQFVLMLEPVAAVSVVMAA